MLRIGIVGCGLQAATIAGYLGIYGDDYEVAAVTDYDFENAKARMAQKKVRIADSCRFFHDVGEFIASAPKLDGIIIGTFCTFHTEVACQLEVLGVPLYIEKPVAISFEQIRRLHAAFRHSKTSIEVSLPMRLCPLTQRAKKMMDDGLVGPVRQVVGFEDTQGDVYFATWFRDAEKTGGMFLQKAVHDIDYMFYLAGGRPVEVCGMRAKVYYRGDKPYDLTCENCSDAVTCPEGPMRLFREKGGAESVSEAAERLSRTSTPDGKFNKKRFCVYSKDIAIEDIGECIVRMDTGTHVAHSQNFIANFHACRRGARFCGDNATLEIDFHRSHLALYSHRNGTVEHCDVDQGKLSHYGGDRELVADFLETMKTGKRGRTDLIEGDGIMSTLTCISARESADTSKFIPISL